MSQGTREVINKQEGSLILHLLEDIENILMVESSGIAQKFIPRDKWVKGVMKRIEKEVLHFTISNLPLLEENEGKAVASDRPELSASEFLENVLNGEWSNSCKGDFLAALGVIQSLLMRFGAEEMMKVVKGERSTEDI